jgi:histidinol-phosphatase (PHP family)
MRVDYHLHSEFSDDSRELMEDQIKQGIVIGLDEMCFTDHVDYGIKRDWDDPLGIEWRDGDNDQGEKDPVANVNYPEYFDTLFCLQVQYENEISVKAGLEFGIQSHTVTQFQRLYDKYKHKLDFILFSMHQVEDKEFWTGEFQEGRTQDEYNRKYYEEILKTMQMYKDYSVLAHLDLIVRYDKNGVYPFEKVKDIIAAILEQASRDDKGIESNTSSWEYGLSDTQPSRAILRLYKDLGGKILTVGSDAHKKEFLGSHFDDAFAILKDEIGFKEIATFNKMIPSFYKL